MKKKNWKKIIGIAVSTLLAVYVIGSVSLIDYFVKFYFSKSDRVNFSTLLRWKDYENLDRETVTFPSGKETLTGYIYGKDNTSLGLVVVSHAVVASEIKGLADTSEQNAIAIEKLITNISSLIQQTELSTRESHSYIKNSSNLMQNTSNTFHTIMGVIEQTGRVLKKFSEEVNKVNEIAMDMANITQQQAASSEEILATTQSVAELVAKTGEKSIALKDGTDALHTASSDLNHEMQYFKV